MSYIPIEQITYVPKNGDIQTYINNASDGDTLVLTNNTYTVSSQITINKKITIKGQGRKATIILNNTLINDGIFRVVSDLVTISDLTLNYTGSGAIGVIVENASSYVILENINMIGSGSGSKYGIQISNVSTYVNNCDIKLTSDGAAYGITLLSLIDTDLKIYNTFVDAVGATSRGLNVIDNTSTTTKKIEVYNSMIIAKHSLYATIGLNVINTINAYGCVFNGSTYDVYETGPNQINLYNCTLVNNLVSGTANYAGKITEKVTDLDLGLYKMSYNNANWTGGHVTYIPLTKTGKTQTEILNEAITAATVGDTLILASGTYTITASVLINKAITIRGQGVNATKIYGSAANLLLLSITVSDVQVSDLTIEFISTEGTGLSVNFNASNVTINNIVIKATGTEGKVGATFISSGVNFSNSSINLLSSNKSATGINIWNPPTSTQNYTVNVENVVVITSGTTSNFAIYGLNNGSSYLTNVNLYNVKSTALDTGVDYAMFIASSITDNKVKVNAYNSIFNGMSADVKNNGLNEINLYGCVLINNIISGTVLYKGNTATTLKKVAIKTADYTLTTMDEIIICNSSTPFTATLPIAIGSGQSYFVKNINAGVVTIDADGTNTIDGQLTKTLNQWDSIEICDYVSNLWVVI